MMKRILLEHADAARVALLSRSLLIDALYAHTSIERAKWQTSAANNEVYANEFSDHAAKLERKHGSVFPGVKP